MKESEMFRANRILEKNKKKEEKLEQLKKVFEKEIKSIVLLTSGKNVFNLKEYIENKASQLIYEVKIRINNK